MRSDSLECLGPLDGRYAEVVAPLRQHFSELALIRRRAEVEAEWLIHVNNNTRLGSMQINEVGKRQLRSIVQSIGLREARRVKALERRTRHDVKALEYFLAEQMRATGLDASRPLLHFACTSWDINNIAFSLSVQEAVRNVMVPALGELQTALVARAREWAGVPMLARTHGQPASPTTVGKEFAVFAARLEPRMDALQGLALPGKMNGATGNYNAHVVALPDFDWPAFCQKFVEKFDLRFAPLTTQIEPYDDFADLCNLMRGINNILLDFCRDMWGYVALDYFAQRRVPGEVGSSAMPHKVNPIDFENAEGNLGISSALFSHFADKLPISRWQRDLSDSTVLRSVGTAFGHALVAWKSALNGLERVGLNNERLASDLDGNWQVLSEAEQTFARAEGIENAYERMRTLTRRGGSEGEAAMRRFVRRVSKKQRLENREPKDYIGIAEKLAREVGNDGEDQ